MYIASVLFQHVQERKEDEQIIIYFRVKINHIQVYIPLHAN